MLGPWAVMMIVVAAGYPHYSDRQLFCFFCVTISHNLQYLWPSGHLGDGSFIGKNLENSMFDRQLLAVLATKQNDKKYVKMCCIFRLTPPKKHVK